MVVSDNNAGTNGLTMRLGMVVRDDQGGLGNLTFRAWEQLRPEVTLVVQWRPCRGVPDSEKFFAEWTETYITDRPIPDATWSKMATMADVWWTAETWYSDTAENILRAANTRSVLYAMPELFDGSQADEVWNPTRYLENRFGLSDVVSWPTTPPEKWEPRTKVRRLLHVSGGASLDRNGTETFLESLHFVETPCDVMLHAPDDNASTLKDAVAKLPEQHNVMVSWGYEKDLSRFYDWADMLVMPRRYAGLCLPAFESFGHACLVLMPDVEPQAYWPIVPVQAEKRRPIRIKGGHVPFWRVDAQVLADRIEDVCSWDTPRVVRASVASREWAEGNSWAEQLPVWEKRLRLKTAS